MLRRAKFFLVVIACGFSSAYSQDLSFYLEAARRSSPLIKDNRNLSTASRLEAERLRAQYSRPLISVTSNYLFAPIINQDNNQSKLELNSPGAEKYYGYDIAASNGGQYQALVNVVQPIFNGERTETLAEQALITSQINENNARLSEHDLEKFVGDQYILCLLDVRQWQYTDSLLQILDEQRQVLMKLSQNGLMKQSDLTLLTIEVQAQQNAKLNFLTTYKRDLLDLNVLCGIADTSLVVLRDISLAVNPDTATSRYLTKYMLDSLNLLAQRKVFDLKYKPLVNVYANSGLNAVYAPTIPNRFGVSAGINFTWNIFDGHQRGINEEKTNVLLRSVAFYKGFFRTQNAVRKQRILNEIGGLDQRLELVKKQLSEYNALMAFYRKELYLGQMPVINYINVLKTQVTAKRDYMLLITNRLLLINMYNYWNW